MQEEKKKRKGYATQAQQREADKRYYHASEENRQRKQYLNTRSTARNFIEKRAKFEDLKDLQERIEKKINTTQVEMVLNNKAIPAYSLEAEQRKWVGIKKYIHRP